MCIKGGEELKGSALISAVASSCVSMKGSWRSQSVGGRGPHSGLLRNRTPVYMIVGTPFASMVQQPEKQPSASAKPGVGRSAGGRCSQWMRSDEIAWPHTRPQSHSQPVVRC